MAQAWTKNAEDGCWYRADGQVRIRKYGGHYRYLVEGLTGPKTPWTIDACITLAAAKRSGGSVQ